MGNCSSVVSGKFHSHPRIFKVSILDLDSSGEELGDGILELTKHELVLHQKGMQTLRWPLGSVMKYDYKGEIFSFKYRSRDLSEPIQRRRFLMKDKEAQILHHIIQNQLIEKDESPKFQKVPQNNQPASKSDDGYIKHLQQGSNCASTICNNQIWSHQALDLATNHFPSSHHCQCQRLVPQSLHTFPPNYHAHHEMPAGSTNFINLPHLPSYNRGVPHWPGNHSQAVHPFSEAPTQPVVMNRNDMRRKSAKLSAVAHRINLNKENRLPANIEEKETYFHDRTYEKSPRSFEVLNIDSGGHRPSQSGNGFMETVYHC